MPEDDKKPDPIEDVRRGLGLLFRAAKGAVDKLPTKELEDVVVTSAREVGRALENVGKTIEREVVRVKDDLKPGSAARGGGETKASETKTEIKTETEREKETKDEPPPATPGDGNGSGSGKT